MQQRHLHKFLLYTLISLFNYFINIFFILHMGALRWLGLCTGPIVAGVTPRIEFGQADEYSACH
jgi:hypothetical protein